MRFSDLSKFFSGCELSPSPAEAWNEALASDVGQRVGKLLFAAVRREAMRWPLDMKDSSWPLKMAHRNS